MSKTKKYISILRGINVGGKRKILMTDLKDLYSDLGFINCITYIQSGNVVFHYKDVPNTEIEQKIEKAISSKYGFDVPVIVRTKEEFHDAVHSNPYLEDKEIDSLCLTFLNQTPQVEKVEIIEKLSFTPDEFQTIGSNVYIFCPGPYHKTKLSNQFFESKLKVKATTRNWKTVMKLLEISCK